MANRREKSVGEQVQWEIGSRGIEVSSVLNMLSLGIYRAFVRRQPARTSLG